MEWEGRRPAVKWLSTGLRSDARRADMRDEARMQVGRRDIAGDEDDARAPVGVRPGVKLHRRMKDVMHAVHGNRRILADQIENAFDAEKVRAGTLTQPRQPG